MTRMVAEDSTPEEVFRGSPLGLELLRGVELLLAGFPPSTMRATKSQVASRGRRGLPICGGPHGTSSPARKVAG